MKEKVRYSRPRRFLPVRTPRRRAKTRDTRAPDRPMGAFPLRTSLLIYGVQYSTQRPSQQRYSSVFDLVQFLPRQNQCIAAVRQEGGTGSDESISIKQVHYWW